MTKKDQRRFVRDLSQSIANDFCDLLAAGKIPDNWDGHELRCWLADRHAAAADRTVIRRDLRGKRAREFKNDIIIRNL